MNNYNIKAIDCDVEHSDIILEENDHDKNKKKKEKWKTLFKLQFLN